MHCQTSCVFLCIPGEKAWFNGTSYCLDVKPETTPENGTIYQLGKCKCAEIQSDQDRNCSAELLIHSHSHLSSLFLNLFRVSFPDHTCYLYPCLNSSILRLIDSLDYKQKNLITLFNIRNSCLNLFNNNQKLKWTFIK